MPNLFEQAWYSQDFFHQSAKVLARQFDLSLKDARGIVQSCPACQKDSLGIGLEVNSCGLWLFSCGKWTLLIFLSLAA